MNKVSNHPNERFRLSSFNNLLFVVVVARFLGTYVGLSALDKDVHQLDTESYFNYADVLRKMGTFDNKFSDILTHSWYSKEGALSKYKQYASTSLGIDTNRTFEKLGLIVYTDGIVTKRLEPCNETAGLLPCLDGNQCYNVTERCGKCSNCFLSNVRFYN